MKHPAPRVGQSAHSCVQIAILFHHCLTLSYRCQWWSKFTPLWHKSAFHWGRSHRGRMKSKLSGRVKINGKEFIFLNKGFIGSSGIYLIVNWLEERGQWEKGKTCVKGHQARNWTRDGCIEDQGLYMWVVLNPSATTAHPRKEFFIYFWRA